MKTPMGNRRCFCLYGELRGAPHSALPNEAGGGEAAAPCRPAPIRAGRRAARQPRLSEVRRLTRRRFTKVRMAAFCREFREIRHGESRGGGKAANAEDGARRRAPSFLMRRSLLVCCSLSHAAAFNSPAIPPHPVKRRHPHEQRFRTCAARLIRLCRMRQAAAKPPPHAAPPP